MISLELMTVLAIGTVGMLISILIVAGKYKVKWWKSSLIAVLLAVTGVVGIYLWFFIENFRFGGRSFYGAVFLVPVVFSLLAVPFRIHRGMILDMCAPAGCIMLAIMKLQCLIDGCCRGRIIYTTNEGVNILFPSQIVESINGILIFCLLMFLIFVKNKTGKIYPWFLILYGSTRFVLNFFRDEWSTFKWPPPFGNIWSILAIAIGVVWLTYLKRKKQVGMNA